VTTTEEHVLLVHRDVSFLAYHHGTKGDGKMALILKTGFF
jgi:hypothetical protein